MLNVKQEGMKQNILVFRMTRLGIDSHSHRPLASTLPIMPNTIVVPIHIELKSYLKELRENTDSLIQNFMWKKIFNSLFIKLFGKYSFVSDTFCPQLISSYITLNWFLRKRLYGKKNGTIGFVDRRIKHKHVRDY